MDNHKGKYKLWLKNEIKYRSVTSYDLFNIYGEDTCDIELLENYPCLNKLELYTREGYYIKLLTSINKVIPGRTKHESYIDNKDKIAAKTAEYYIKNKKYMRTEKIKIF
jgi:hypothetical protein